MRSVHAALIWSVVVTLLALLVFGYIKGRFTTARPFRSAWQTVIVGGIAANDNGPDQQGDTQVLRRRSADGDKEFAKATVQVSLAGLVAEMIYTGDPHHPGLVAEWVADWQAAWAAAIPLHPDEPKPLQYLEQVSVQLYHRLKQDEMWAALASLADQLLARETLDGEQVEEVVRDWLA